MDNVLLKNAAQSHLVLRRITSASVVIVCWMQRVVAVQRVGSVSRHLVDAWPYALDLNARTANFQWLLITTH